MKKIFFAVVALAAMSSCSKDQTVAEAPQQEIQFGNVFVDNATRVDYSDGQELISFNVYGTVTGTEGTVNIFDGDEVTGSVGTNVWTYVDADTKAEYWIPGAAYKFAAVVDANVADKDTNGMPLTLTTVADANSNLEDMLYAEASVASAVANQGIVNFTFSHLLSKVKFTVKSNAEGDYYHTVTGIKVSNFETGTYTINSGSWAGTGSKAVEFAEIANVKSTDNNGKSNADMLLVPNAEKFNVTFTVDLYKGGSKFGTETKTIEVDTDLLKGNAYNFVINCSVGNPIEFSVTNDPAWTPQPDVTIP